MKLILTLSATAVLLCACGKTDAGARDAAANTDTDTVAATTGTDTDADAGVQLELLAVEFYNTAVFREPTEEYLTSRCTLPFVDKLRAAYDMDGEGYATWLLRTPAQDGDGPTCVTGARLVDDNTVEVQYLDMGQAGATVLIFTDIDGEPRIEDAATPDGISVFDAF